MRTALLATCGIAVLLVTAGCAAQKSPAARLAPSPRSAAAHDLPQDYQPLHKGSVDLATGLYTRQNEDLVVHGTPALILRRTYLSGYRAPKQFGIGALHTGEEYLIGDGERFQWASLILARGTRINFKRVSPGTSILNAQFIHDETPTEWHGAQLSWTGLTWVVQKPDGSTVTFKGCVSLPGSICSILQSRDAHGHTIYYRRNLAGALLEMADGAGRSIAFEYDGSGRIRRAHASTGREVRYEYDDRGRLAAATASDGLEYRYTYTDLDELATIEEPGTSIENTYAEGRCVHQVNRYPDSAPYIFDFTYYVEGASIVRTDTETSDGTYRRYTWDEGRRTKTEALGMVGYDPIVFTYERDSATKAVTALAMTCPDFGAGPLRQSRPVTAGTEERVKSDLMRYCFESALRRR